ITRLEMCSNGMEKPVRAHGTSGGIRKRGRSTKSDSTAAGIEFARRGETQPPSRQKEEKPRLLHLSRLAEQYRERKEHSGRLQAVHGGRDIPCALVEHLLGFRLRRRRLSPRRSHVPAPENATGSTHSGPRANDRGAGQVQETFPIGPDQPSSEARQDLG